MSAQSRTVSELKKVAEGREAEMFEWERGKLLRLLRNPEHAGAMRWEAASARAATEGGVRVPATYELLAVDGRPGMVVEKIQGRDLLAEIAAKPWRVWSIGKACGALHARLNSVAAGTELPELRARLAEQIRGSDRVPDLYAKFAARELGDLPEGHRLCHGDFHPGNVLRTVDELVVIDWPNAMRGDYHADFARSTLMLRLGDPPPGTPWLIRFGATFARGLLKRSYEGAYRRAAKVDPVLNMRWELVRAIHRLQDGIESEREKLLRLIDERLSA
jgi:tRNA A-37 threonylcarbamoyl transferase component Bud32